MMSEIVYLRLRYKIKVPKKHTLVLGDIALVSAPSKQKQKELEEIVLYQISESDQNLVIVDAFSVIDQLQQYYSSLEFQPIGPNQTIVVIKRQEKKPSLLVVTTIWLLLFIGAAMAIMNFHYDVSMQSVQQDLHFILTGNKSEYPLWIQIPYSLGLGVGMILFFNHIFKKRINEEPSPLEIEMFKYEQDLDQYIVLNENKVSKKDVINKSR